MAYFFCIHSSPLSVTHLMNVNVLLVVGRLARLYLTENLELNQKGPTLRSFEQRASWEERTEERGWWVEQKEEQGTAWLGGCVFWWRWGGNAVLYPRSTWWHNPAVYPEQCVTHLEAFNPERRMTWCRRYYTLLTQWRTQEDRGPMLAGPIAQKELTAGHPQQAFRVRGFCV